MLYLILFTSLWIASKSQTTTDPCDSYPDNCDPTVPYACSNYGNSYQCLPSQWYNNECNSCQECECTASVGGCGTGKICEESSPPANNGCGFCVDDPCPGECDDAISDTCSSFGTDFVCMDDITSGCKTCQECACTSSGGCTSPQTCDLAGAGGSTSQCGVCVDPDPCKNYPDNCDPTVTDVCSNLGSSYQCLPSQWYNNECNSCQECECTEFGGCGTGKTCEDASPPADNGCGVCVDDPTPCLNECDPDPTLNTCSSLGSTFVCMLDSTSGCKTCQDPCDSSPYNCDPTVTNVCGNYGYQCLSSQYNGYACHSCQCECTLTTGCETGQSCDIDSSGGSNTQCGTCVDNCIGIVTCAGEWDCSNSGTPTTVGSCVDVNNDGCKVCVYVDDCPNGCADDAGCLTEYECENIDENTGCGTCLLKDRCSDTDECIFGATAADDGCTGGMICAESATNNICGVCECEECATDDDCQGECVKDTLSGVVAACGTCEEIIIKNDVTPSPLTKDDSGCECIVGREEDCETGDICTGEDVCGTCKEDANVENVRINGANQYGIMMGIGFVMMIVSWV